MVKNDVSEKTKQRLPLLLVRKQDQLRSLPINHSKLSFSTAQPNPWTVLYGYKLSSSSHCHLGKQRLSSYGFCRARSQRAHTYWFIYLLSLDSDCQLFLQSQCCPKIGERDKVTETKRTRTRKCLLQISLLSHVHTFAANRHSITLILKWEVAALFISTQLLAITNTAPLGSLTSVALKGLNSINLAYWKKNGRGDIIY